MTSHNQYDYLEDITVTDADKNLKYQLVEQNGVVARVVIKNGFYQNKGDTTSYRASDFQVDANANVEELLKNFLEFRLIKVQSKPWVKPLRRYW
jgi:hypothetical protein